MIHFVTNKGKFEEIELKFKKNFKEIFHESEDNFSEDFCFIFGFEFEMLFEDFFFETLKNVTNMLNEDNFYFYTVEPLPREYFYHHFQKYNAFAIPKYATEDDFNKILMEDPGDSPADAIAINCSIITMFADSNRWASIGFRDEGVALIGFKDKEVMQTFFSSKNLNLSNFTKLGNVSD